MLQTGPPIMTAKVIAFPAGFVPKDADAVAADLWRRLKSGGSVSGDDVREFGVMLVLEDAAQQWVARGLLHMEKVAGVKHFKVTPLGMQTDCWDPVIANDAPFIELRRLLANFLKECSP